MKHQGLDHLAIVVDDTETALQCWRDRLGFPVLFSEVVADGTVRLTHLDLGNCHLQLVEPLTADHPLQQWLTDHGSGLHHLCLKVDDVGEFIKQSPVPTASVPHQGTRGQRAVFLDRNFTNDIQIEVTGT